MDGILVLNKPQGMTSFDVIAKLRRQYNQKKFGHAGTLDPMASGVLVVLAGKACKLLPYLADTDKEYIAGLELGSRYDSDDVFGTIEETKPVNADFDLQKVLDSFVGKQRQRVPKASAKKVDGKKLYEYLRKGQDVPDVYTDIEIYAAKVLDPKALTFQVACSSGTYIRSLCRDLAEKTGNAGAMKSLIRTKANGFDISQAEELGSDLTVHPLDSILNFPKVQAENAADVRNGKAQRFDETAEYVSVMDGEELLAIYRKKPGTDHLYTCARGVWA